MKYCSPLTESEKEKLEISDLNLGWVAGILEGEGSFFMYKRSNRNPTPRMGLQSTDLDVVLRLQSLLGGNVSNAIIRSPHKAAYQWSLCRRPVVVEWLKKLLPHMGERRSDKIREILKEYDG